MGGWFDNYWFERRFIPLAMVTAVLALLTWLVQPSLPVVPLFLLSLLVGGVVRWLLLKVTSRRLLSKILAATLAWGWARFDTALVISNGSHSELLYLPWLVAIVFLLIPWFSSPLDVLREVRCYFWARLPYITWRIKNRKDKSF